MTHTKYTTLVAAAAMFALLVSNVASGAIVAQYTFDGHAQDAGPNGLHGTVYGASLTTDRHGNAHSAYHFDGNDWINLTNSGLWKITDTITMDSWFRATAPIGGWPTIFMKQSPNSGQAYQIMLRNQAVMPEITTTTGNYYQESINPIFNYGTWYRYTVSYNAATGQIRGWLNGNLVNSLNIPPSPIVHSNFAPAIGAHNLGSSRSNFFLGDLDEITIFDEALTPQQVDAALNPPPTIPGPLALGAGLLLFTINLINKRKGVMG